MWYSLTALLAAAAAAALDLFVARTRLLTRRDFWVAYAIVVGFQLLVNGLLTGLSIVRYDPARIVGLRLAFAPVEDLFFGFALVVITLVGWARATHAAGPRRHRADR